MSTLFLVMMGATATRAHEVTPGIANLTLGPEMLTLELRMNLEAFVAGIDLDGVQDTNTTEESTGYDALHALSPDALETAFRDVFPKFQSGLKLNANGTSLTLTLDSVAVPETRGPDLPRTSTLMMSATWPEGADAVSFGWAREYGTLIVRQMGTGDDLYTGFLTGGQVSPPIPRNGGVTLGVWETFATYVVIGFEHIIPKGLDHILFVLGLFFLAMRVRPLVTQITAFTLAHTITLALGVLGLVTVPASVVEPLIALSIVYVAVENILSPQMTKWRPLVVVLFGLLHGLGFASVLGEIGLNPAQFATSLIAFNIGVEIGQLTVILIAFLLVGLWFGQKDWYRARIAIPASVFIAVIGAWWSFERVFL